MNSVAMDGAIAAAAEPCFHCGIAVPAGVRFEVLFDGRSRHLCCAGCAAVATTILEAGLAGYYRDRTAFPEGPAQTVADSLRLLQRYDLAGVRERYVADDDQDGAVALLSLEGLNCAACAWLVERRLLSLDGMREASVNYATHRAQVRWQRDAIPLSDILSAIAQVGVQAYPADAALEDQYRSASRKRALWELFVAAFAMMQVMMYTVPLYLADPGEVTPDLKQLMQWAGFILTLPVLVFSARPIFRNAWHSIAARSFGMDVPVSLAILLGFGASTVALLGGGGEVYFDSITMFVLLLLTARFVDSELRRRRQRSLESLARSLPAAAERLANYPEDTCAEDVASAALQPGDMVRIATGATVPADGVLIDGVGQCDESLLSGESLPVPKRRGDGVIGGSINLGSPLIARVTRVGASSVMAGIVRASEAALAARPKLEGKANTFAAQLSFATVLLAALACGAWLWADPSRALGITVAILAITCPCALALAIPATTAAAAARMAKAGLIVQRGRLFDALPQVTDVALDKTGTLTSGNMALAGIEAGTLSADQALAIAAALEIGSHHPIARALLSEAERRGLTLPKATQLSIQPDGVAGNIAGGPWTLGRQPVASTGQEEGLPRGAANTAVLLCRNGAPVAKFLLQDELRPDAADSVAALLRRGIGVHLLSGDAPAPVRDCAGQIGITHWQAGMSPEDKCRYVQALQANGGRVLAIGDGVNDGPLLAQANVGIAIHGGADLARTRADAILAGGRLWPVLEAIQIAARARRTIQQNLAWAFAYNLVCLPLAAAGMVTPQFAAIGMSASSLLVIANAARLSSGPR